MGGVDEETFLILLGFERSISAMALVALVFLYLVQWSYLRFSSEMYYIAQKQQCKSFIVRYILASSHK